MPVNIIVPKLEMAQESATIIEWLKKEGERVEKGDPLFVIETDKVTVEIESPGSGILAGIRADPGQEIPVTQVVAYLLAPGEEVPTDVPAERVSKPSRVARPEASVSATPIAKRLALEHGVDMTTISGSGSQGKITKQDVQKAIDAQPAARPEVLSGKVRATPAARRLAKERGLNLSTVVGTGPGGRVTVDDVESHVDKPTPSTIEIAERIPLVGMRKRIAERMTRSVQTAPHISVSLRVHVEPLNEVREGLNARVGDAERITITAALVRAVAKALQGDRIFNSSLQGDEIHVYQEINIGVAVAIEDGLIVPVIHQADRMDMLETARAINDKATRAREGKLSPADVANGTFTITNLGPFGIEHFTPIINPPQAGILAVGAVRPQATLDDSGEIIFRSSAWFTLTTDHRIVDGAIAARFLSNLRDIIENPEDLT